MPEALAQVDHALGYMPEVLAHVDHQPIVPNVTLLSVTYRSIVDVVSHPAARLLASAAV